MPIKRVRRKIHHLRRQPEDVRLRAASYATLIGGLILSVLWVTVFLPLQLRLAGGIDNDDEVPQENQALIQSDNDQAPRVGGARDESSGRQLFYTAPPQIDAQGTVVNPTNASGNESTSPTSQDPGAENAGGNNTADDPETVPVEVTE